MDEEQQPILEEQSVNQQVIPFEGDDLAAAQSPTGEIYISLPGACAALGLNTVGQMQRIQRTPTLAKGLRRMRLQTGKRGMQNVNCLRLDRVALWLAGMETARMKPAIAAKIEVYQDDLAPVAMRVFMRSLNLAPSAPVSTEPRALLAEQADALIDIALFIREHGADLAAIPSRIEDAIALLESLTGDVDKMKIKTAGLTPAQQAKVKEAVDIIVTKSAGVMNHAKVFAALKRRFTVASYKQIPDSEYEVVLTFLRGLWSQVKNDEAPEQGKLL